MSNDDKLVFFGDNDPLDKDAYWCLCAGVATIPLLFSIMGEVSIVLSEELEYLEGIPFSEEVSGEVSSVSFKREDIQELLALGVVKQVFLLTNKDHITRLLFTGFIMTNQEIEA